MSEDFPYLDEETRIEFPAPDECPADAPAVVGGNLSPGVLLSAYEQGFFPWFNPGDPFYWWNPDPRFVLIPDSLHVSRRFRRSLRKTSFSYTLDRDFSSVINSCSRIPRPGQDGTWITGDMIQAYNELHRLGYAHSVEVWSPDEGEGKVLAGGLYGISLGKCFFGESMFSRVSGASRAALILLSRMLGAMGWEMIDCQVRTEHITALGGVEIPRAEYFNILKSGLEKEGLKGSWDGIFELSLED